MNKVLLINSQPQHQWCLSFVNQHTLNHSSPFNVFASSVSHSSLFAVLRIIRRIPEPIVMVELRFIVEAEKLLRVKCC